MIFATQNPGCLLGWFTKSQNVKDTVLGNDFLVKAYLSLKWPFGNRMLESLRFVWVREWVLVMEVTTESIAYNGMM